MMLAAATWITRLADANDNTRVLVVYSIATIAIGLYSVISRALFTPDIKIGVTSSTLRDEPPAVVNLLVNDLVLSADASTSVLLHLSHRGHFTISKSDDGDETVALTVSQESSRLRKYEQLVVDLVCQTASTDNIEGAIPVDNFRSHANNNTIGMQSWKAKFRDAVVEDALSRNLVVRLCSNSMVTILRCFVGVLAVLGLATLSRSSLPLESDPQSWAVGLLTCSIALTLISLAKLDRNELRYTRKGSTATSQWLGARSAMQHVGSFSDVGPSAVNIWGEHMCYATSVGVARETSRRLQLVNGDGTEAWYIVNDRWHHAKAAIPTIHGWGGSPWKHLRDAVLPFVVSAGALSSVGVIVWVGKIKSDPSSGTALQRTINKMMHFPQRLAWVEAPSVLALVVFGGLLWVLRGHMKRASPICRALLDLVMCRQEQGVIAYEHEGWIGIGNPHLRLMTLYKIPKDLVVTRNSQVVLIATRYFGRVKAVTPYEPPKPRRAAFS